MEVFDFPQDLCIIARSTQYGISSSFFIALCVVIGYTVGTLVFISARGIAIVRRYCKKYVSYDRISALSPDKLCRLKKIGQFSLDLDAATAIPGFAFLVSYYKGTPINSLSGGVTLAVYTAIAITVFFLPQYPFHEKMAHAKEQAFSEVDRMFKQAYSRIWNEYETYDPESVSALKDTYVLHDRISNMSVWPLNLGGGLRFMVTAIFPILPTLLPYLQIILSYL